MKYIYTLLITVLLFTGVQAQQAHQRIPQSGKFIMAAIQPARGQSEIIPLIPEKIKDSPVFRANTVVETTIGTSIYDLQTSGSSASHIYRFNDGSIDSVWMYGVSTPDFPDRGTAYNYFDGSAWGPEPSSRIENVKTGYPSYAAYGPDGEATLAHDFTNPGAMILCKRNQKGTGNWIQTSIPGPTGQNGLAWPRLVSSGPNHEYLHSIAITRPTNYAGGTLYQGLNGAILYSRSTDGGATWNISNSLLPGMTSAEYNGFESNSYAFAEPVGNTIAFVVGDTWTDLFLMKSNDNGDTWTKTVIFQHPYPKFVEGSDLVTDTPWVCDGGVAIALDNTGKAHVAFGLMRVLNTDTTDGTTSYFPYTDGLVYWNEDMPTFTSLNYDNLWNNNHLVGYLQDMNGNDTVMEFLAIGIYYLSLTGMPSIMIDDFYGSQRIVLAFASVMENLDNGSENYRHVWFRTSQDGVNWTDFTDLTGSIIHNFDECVFPFLSPTSNGSNFYLVYQKDEEPGMAVWGSDPPDPFTTNYLIVNTYTLPDIDTLGINPYKELSAIQFSCSPNPACNYLNISTVLNKPETTTLEVRNALGEIVFQSTLAVLSSGEYTYTLDISGYRPGLYFFTAISGNQRITHKQIIQ